ncbi:DMT family transporter [Maribacter cobaltidurans]|uniref:EamA family transporter n=1 Tax=Maribacter cobaltidurans TaxID=1178778 RepID=A0A223V4S6_9FLAO|nr:DMT family transporter [Maribacter cobaltidurans]ASV30401.1 EamA family transporter [Maribacter cobaltidurans]GGD78337.1 multidrug transporter [Maribacter cobaltidurans]
MSRRTLAILAALGATTIYALNHTIAKGVMPNYVQPFGFIMLRVTGAALLFWIFSLLGPKQKIEKRDWGRLLFCSIFGMVINMLAFFKGLQLSTPINSSVLVTVTPIIVVILSALWIKEKISWQKASGILMGFVGALLLILMGAEIRQDAPNIPMGNILLIVNATAYGTYLILVKKLIEKYHPFTLMKWLFTIGVVINFPITFNEVSAIEWSSIPLQVYAAIAFVIVGTTFLTYLFNVFALTQLKASTVSAFTYLQPLIGILFALGTGNDNLSLIKILAALLVLAGVYLASRKPKVPKIKIE